MKIIFLLTMLLVTFTAHAKSFGVIGEVFPIGERSFLALIQERLRLMSQNGELEHLNQRWVKSVAGYANRPQPLNLKRSFKTSVHSYTPEVILDQDITDINGNILYQKGLLLNPLIQMPVYQPCWLFFNADDIAQLRWARKEMTRCTNPKLILTAGAIITAEKTLNAVIYFDQGGRITNRLNIESVPTKVTRKGHQLRIASYAIKENGDVL